MYKHFFKRVFDIVIALITLPFLGIIFMIVAPIIYFTDKGPVFYNAPRLGKGGEIFKMYKFRSMYMNVPDIRNADGSTYNGENDPRVTPIGAFLRKTSLDEVPQCLNVFLGSMSIVGPRPDLPEQYGLYSESDRKKLQVRPGITGLNQAYYRNSVEWKERLKNDVRYVNNISFMLDLKIVFRTVFSVLGRKNVYISDIKLESKQEIANKIQ